MAYDWPGNVRELQNVMERALVTAKEGRIDCATLIPEKAPTRITGGETVYQPPSSGFFTVKQMLRFERENLICALEKTGWQVAGRKGAASLLGMPPSTLNSRMKALGIRRLT
jgi:transcriptional regulator with GAF, ATPase, and Fis domain